MNAFEIVISILTAIYVGATILYVRISGSTLHVIRDQGISSTKQFIEQIAEAKKTADAALLNAQAVINAERAWIIPKMKKLSGGTTFMLTLFNFGKTPAEIVGVDHRDLFPDKLDDLPLEPDYGLETRFMQMRILCANEEWPYEATSLDVVPDMKPIRASTQRFVVAYRVRYLDLLKNPHESRVCYFWSPMLEDFIPAGPPAWTQYT
jgi:hypothetical protein